MSFKKPFRAVPVRPSPKHLKVVAGRERRTSRSWFSACLAFVVVFIGGMIVTNWEAVFAKSGFVQPSASDCPLLTVHDGDTIRCGSERIRIANIDAPELPDSPKCTDPRRRGWCDYAQGYRSRDALRTFLEAGPVTVNRDGADKYGRTLATVSVQGRDAGEYLIAQGLARPWQ